MKIKEIKEIKPTFNGVITTADRNEKSSIIHGVQQLKELEGQLQTVQRVVSIGNTVRNCEVGDVVIVSFDMYAQLKHLPGSLAETTIKDNPVVSYQIPTITIDGKEYLRLVDTDIKEIIESCTYIENGAEKVYKKKKEK